MREEIAEIEAARDALGRSVMLLLGYNLPGTAMDCSWTCRPPTVDPAPQRRSPGVVKYPCDQRVRRVAVTVRWRGSRPRTDTTHCPISRY